MVHSKKSVECSFQVRRKILALVVGTYLSDGKRENEIDNWIGSALAALLQSLYCGCEAGA